MRENTLEKGWEGRIRECHGVLFGQKQVVFLSQENVGLLVELVDVDHQVINPLRCEGLRFGMLGGVSNVFGCVDNLLLCRW